MTYWLDENAKHGPRRRKRHQYERGCFHVMVEWGSVVIVALLVVAARLAKT